MRSGALPKSQKSSVAAAADTPDGRSHDVIEKKKASRSYRQNIVFLAKK